MAVLIIAEELTRLERYDNRKAKYRKIGNCTHVFTVNTMASVPTIGALAIRKITSREKMV
jgi:hypothetical protein